MKKQNTSPQKKKTKISNYETHKIKKKKLKWISIHNEYILNKLISLEEMETLRMH